MWTWARAAVVAAMGFAASGCGDSLGAGGGVPVSLSFRVADGGTSSSSSTAIGTAPIEGPQAVAGAPMVLVGTNGTLTVEEIVLVVDEVELEGDDDGACNGGDGDGGSDDDCEFEAPARVLDLPLDGMPVAAVTVLVPAGTYDELEFEVDDLDDDGDADDATVHAQLLALVPDWPRKASVMVRGTFETLEGEVVSFRVFLEAEIEVEIELRPPLVIADDGSASYDLVVDVRPSLWFTSADGSVLPLHLLDHDLTGLLVELEVEMEDGFVEVEIDR